MGFSTVNPCKFKLFPDILKTPLLVRSRLQREWKNRRQFFFKEAKTKFHEHQWK